MEHRKLGYSGLYISEITYGNWLTHGSQVEKDAATQCVSRRSTWASPPSTPPTSTPTPRRRRCWARRSRASGARPGDLHQGLLAHRAEGQNDRGPVPQAHHGVDQRLAAPAADRLRRPLPGPPLRLRDAAGGDDAGLRRRRPRRARRSTSASVEWTAEQIRDGRRARQGARLPAHLEPAAVLHAVAGHRGTRSCRRARSWASARSSGRPIAQGVLTGKYAAGRAAARGLAGDRREGRCRHDQALHGRRRAHPRAAAQADRRRGRPDHGSSPSRGCCRTPTSQRRSSARPGPSRSSTTSGPQE